jgi:Hom_end-associated Hint/Homing endonuclease/Helicase conserved C-terminal domain
MINLTHPELAEITNKALPPASLDALKELRNEMCQSSQTASFTLQSQQRFLRRVLSPDSPVRSVFMFHGTGVGKCHGKGTPILMFDGSCKAVEDVVVGDRLMGDDSTPRIIQSLARGRDQMFRITSVKGESYVVNSEHILCLQHTSTRNQITEIAVKDYLQLSAKLQRNLKGYRTAVDFAPQPVAFDPYILGVWLGDGSKRDPIITSQDAVILHYLRNFCKDNNAVLTFQSNYEYRVSSISKQHENVFLTFLKEHNLINNKHIPDCFKINSRQVRLQVLAGLIDTDGYLTNNVYEIIQKSKQLADDIVFLARSVGLSTRTVLVEKACIYKGERRAGMYYRTYISGDTDMIPVKILRKTAQPRTQIKDVLRYGITVTPLGEDDYYGFMIDGNHRYVLGDFTVTHNTCTAIQVAEEYILRPEFQESKVLIVASAAVQDNFHSQIFDMSRVNVDAMSGMLESKQCTGRRYLDMLLRIESEPKNWNNPDVRDRLSKTANKLIDEFYEFSTYASFGNEINKKLGGTEADVDEAWVHKTFDNRLVIIDEAHNLRESKDAVGIKGVTRGLENLVKIANGMTLVFLSATPMFDTWEEIIFYVNLTKWNDRRQGPKESVGVSDFFNPDATLRGDAGGQAFRDWCQEYVSYVKGESPFTFPFRLPPPHVAPNTVTLNFYGKNIGDDERMRYLSVVASPAAGIQQTKLSAVKGAGGDDLDKLEANMRPTLAVLPDNKTFDQSFRVSGKQYTYVGSPFLTPAELPNHAGKFATVIQSILDSKGVVLVYSNYVKYGARLFSMALEEHGFSPAFGKTLLASPSYTGTPRGKYILLTSDASETDISKMLSAVKSSRNRTGEQIRVIVASPIGSEGVDFRYVRQIHVLDPWWNSSRIEQVVGRGLRTCSHQLLPFEDQNCSVYFHVMRNGDSECFDEHTYRTRVEAKAVKIARVRKVMAESAMDCSLQNTLNTLPEDWKNLPVPQRRAEGEAQVTYRLRAMLAPTFDETPEVAQCIVKPSPEDPSHVRPLSTYLDVRDELLTRLAALLVDKPIWDREDLIRALRPYTMDVIIYNVQQAIASGFRFKDAFGRPSLLESKGDLYTLAPLGIPNSTLVERTSRPGIRGSVPLPERVAPPAPAPEVAVATAAPTDIDERRASYPWPGDAATRFSASILNSFLFDHELTEAEKVTYLRSGTADLPFADRLRVPGTNLFVRGNGTFDPPEDPVGDDRTRFQEWTSALVARFIANKDRVFASLTDVNGKDAKFTITKMVPGSSPPQRLINKTDKRFEPVACGTGAYTKDIILALSKAVDTQGKGVPADPRIKSSGMCIYTELLIREEHECFWLTPEERSVLYDNKDNRAAFTKAFKA